MANRLRLAAAGFVVLVILFPVRVSSVSAKDLTKIRFTHEWRIEAPLAPYFVALDKGYYRDEGLDVTIDPGPGSIDGINRVAAGAYDMGQADINALIKYRDSADAVPIKAVMMAYNQAAFAIVTLKKNNIRSPKDLEGRILGAPANDGAYAHWPIIVKLNNVDASKVKIENVSFAVRETLLMQGRVDAVTGFMGAKLALRKAGIPDDQIVILPLSKFGLQLYGGAIIAGPQFIKDHPEAVKGFVRATIRGYMDTFADPESAIKLVVKVNPLINKDAALEQLKELIQCCYLTDDVRKNGFGGIDPDRLNKSVSQLAIAFPFRNKPTAADIFTSEFLPPLAERLPK